MSAKLVGMSLLGGVLMLSIMIVHNPGPIEGSPELLGIGPFLENRAGKGSAPGGEDARVRREPSSDQWSRRSDHHKHHTITRGSDEP